MSAVAGKLQSRKFMLAVVAIVVSSIFLGFDYASFDEWSIFVEVVLGLYLTSNVGSKGIDVVRKRREHDRDEGEGEVVEEEKKDSA